MKVIDNTRNFAETGLPLFAQVLSPVRFWPQHTHDNEEVAIVLSGRGTHSVDDVEHPVCAGDVFVMHRGCVHSFTDPEGMVLGNIMFDRETLDLPFAGLKSIPGFRALFELEPVARMNRQFGHYLRLPPRSLFIVRAMMEALINELTRQPAGYVHVALAQVTTLFMTLGRCFEEESPGRPTLAGIAKALTYMETNYHSDMTVAQLADKAHMSVSTLSRNFKSCLGESPVATLMGIRLQEACKRLQESHDPITRIALETGFHASDYFSRFFKQRMGLSPREFRKGVKGGA